jgi:hypothetical protein
MKFGFERATRQSGSHHEAEAGNFAINTRYHVREVIRNGPSWHSSLAPGAYSRLVRLRRSAEPV